jgi:hypothetical protein
MLLEARGRFKAGVMLVHHLIEAIIDLLRSQIHMTGQQTVADWLLVLLCR